MILSSLFKYYQADSAVHRLDVRVKIVFLIVFSLAVVIFEHPAVLLGLFLASLAFHFAARIPFEKSKYLFCSYFFMIFTVAFTQGIFYYGPRQHLLFEIIPGHIGFYAEGLIYGLIQSLRALAILTVGWTVALTTHPMDLMFGLRRFKFPFEFCFLIAMSLRFLPQMLDHAQANYRAQRARGFVFSKFSFRDKWQAFIRMLATVLLTSLQTARDTALAIDLRAFRAYPQRTYVRSSELRFQDKCWMIALALLTVLMAAARLGGWGVGSEFNQGPGVGG